MTSWSSRPRGVSVARLRKNRAAAGVQEGVVAGGAHVRLDRPGDVGDDVDLLVPGEHLQAAAARPDDERRRHVLARDRALPGVPRAAEPGVLGVAPSGVEREDAVLDDPAGDLGLDSSEEGELEDVRVPEDVALVAVTRKPLRADRGAAAVRRSRGDQLGRREAHADLGVLIPVDLDVGDVPDLCPRRSMGVEQRVEAGVLGRPGNADGGWPGQRDLALGVDGDEAVDPELVARGEIAFDGPAAHVLAGNVLAGERRVACGGAHGEHVVDGHAVSGRPAVEDGDLADAACRDHLDVGKRPVRLVRVQCGDDLDSGPGTVLDRQLQANGADVAVGEAHDPLGPEPQGAAVGIDAAQRTLEPERTQVEPAGVLEDVPFPGAQVPPSDRDLGGGPVGDHHQVLLAGRHPVEEAGDVRARRRARPALVRRSANAQKPVREGEQRLGGRLGHGVVARPLDHPPVGRGRWADRLLRLGRRRGGGGTEIGLRIQELDEGRRASAHVDDARRDAVRLAPDRDDRRTRRQP